jgi:hypothetical protein
MPTLRREGHAELDEFFIPQDVPGDLTWRRRFLKKSEQGEVNLLFDVMKAMAGKGGTSLPQSKPGLTALKGTSLDWMVMPPSSWKRDFTHLAKAAIVEERRWVKYRRTIVTATSIVHFRDQLAKKMALHANKRYHGGKVVYDWSFCDGLVPNDLKKVKGLVDRTFLDRLRLIQSQLDAATYIREIEDTIRSIEKRRVASPDGVVGPEIEFNVAEAEALLIEVSLTNPVCR